MDSPGGATTEPRNKANKLVIMFLPLYIWLWVITSSIYQFPLPKTKLCNSKQIGPHRPVCTHFPCHHLAVHVYVHICFFPYTNAGTCKTSSDSQKCRQTVPTPRASILALLEPPKCNIMQQMNMLPICCSFCVFLLGILC